MRGQGTASGDPGMEEEPTCDVWSLASVFPRNRLGSGVGESMVIIAAKVSLFSLISEFCPPLVFMLHIKALLTKFLASH